MKKVLCLFVLLCMICSLSAAVAEAAVSATFDALEDPEFGAVFLGCTLDEFVQAGFQIGDSCDVQLSNGFCLEDVPVYDGYYGRTGSALIALYPGYAHPAFSYCNTGDMWRSSGTKAGDSATVTLRTRGKYADIENTMSAVFSNDRSDYPSDEVFANFREFSGGRLRGGMFFRGASPVDDCNRRAAVTDALIRKYGIGFVLDLADTEAKATSYPCFAGSQFEKLYADGCVTCLGLTAAYRNPAYAAALADGFRRMIRQDRPVYIHCTEGKDRTGFACLLLEALTGANYEELLRDFMASFENLYNMTETGTPEKYAATVNIRFRDILDWLAGTSENDDLSGQTFEQPAREYLVYGGMSEEEIEALIRYLEG